MVLNKYRNFSASLRNTDLEDSDTALKLLWSLRATDGPRETPNPEAPATSRLAEPESMVSPNPRC